MSGLAAVRPANIAASLYFSIVPAGSLDSVKRHIRAE